MTAVTEAVAKPDLRAVLLDALEDAYWLRRAEIVGCRDCTRSVAGICANHQADNDAAYEYDEARKQLQRTPGDPEVLSVFAGIVAAPAAGGEN